MISRGYWRNVLLPAMVPLLLAAAGQSLISGRSFNLAASVLVLFSAGLYLKLLNRHWGEVEDSVGEIPRFKRLVWLVLIVFILNTLLKVLATAPASINLLIWPALPLFAAILFILLTLLLQLVRLSSGDWGKKSLLALSAILAVLTVVLEIYGSVEFLVFFFLGAWIFKFEECAHIPRREKIKLALFSLFVLIFVAVNANVPTNADTAPSINEPQAKSYLDLLSGLTPISNGLVMTLRHLIAALVILMPLKVLLYPVAEWLRSSIRIRTKLMLSYLFSSVIPMLLLAVILLAGYLFTIGSYYQRFITQLISTRASSLLDRLDLRGGVLPAIPGNRLVERMDEEGISAALFDVGHQDRHGGATYLVQTPFPSFTVKDSTLIQMGQERFNGLLITDSGYYLTQWAASGDWIIGVFKEFTFSDLLQLKSQCGMDLTMHPRGSVRVRFGGNQAVEFTTGNDTIESSLTTYAATGSKSDVRLISLPILVPGLVFNDKDEVVPSNILFTFTLSPKTLFANLFSTDSIINRVYLVFFAALTVILGAILVLVAMIGFGLAGGITHSIGLLRKGTEQIGQGNLAAKIHIHSRDELGQLAESFNSMTADLGRMLDEMKEKERMVGELEAARAIQMKLLPQAPPQIPGYRIAAESLPAKQVGGDYYDFLMDSSGRMGMVVGDVSGKGMPAALLMANLQASLHALFESGLETQELAARLNRVLYTNTEPEMFATFFFGMLDPKSGGLIYVNAGHNPPVLCGNGRLVQLPAGGLPLGVRLEAEYVSGQVTLRPGELVALYSDGIVEALDDQEREFGEEKFIALLCQHGGEDPEVILRTVLREVEAYCGTPQDDVTLVIVKRMPLG
jgi:serine phosphatase RsbU (regulator of sigma subunit)